MFSRDHWVVAATRRAAIFLYVVMLLAGTAILIGAAFIDLFNPHTDFWRALDAVTAFSEHKSAWTVAFVVAGTIAVADIVFRHQRLYPRY